MRDQRTIKTKTYKPFSCEDVVNYCITAIVYNTGRKTKVLDEFGVWVLGIIKKKINETFKVSFCSCGPVHASCCLSNMKEIYMRTPLELGGQN